MTPVILIASAAYVEPELEAEFGRLPPAFLPLGNRRLFVHQHTALGLAASRVLLSLPEDFLLDPTDSDQIAGLGIEIIRVPPSLTLGQSIVYVINVSAIAESSFCLLHGDTLSQGLDVTTSDFVSVETSVPPGYRWGYVREEMGRLTLADDSNENSDAVALTGLFAFSSASLLVQSVTRAGGDFLKGLAGYSRERPLRTVKANKWLDFGHASTYHLSRQAVTTEREFNKLLPDRRSITKSGSDHGKIAAEAQWFESLPPPLRVFTPAFLGRSDRVPSISYSIEYLHLPTLADLFVFGRLSRRTWDQILEACAEFLAACAGYKAESGNTRNNRSLYGEKTQRRLEVFSNTSGINLTQPCRLDDTHLPSLEDIVRRVSAIIVDNPDQTETLIHGDFCFSNIFYDFRSHCIRVIDPRGIDAQGTPTSFGDRRYDIAKLYHSAIGKYDLIVAGAFQLQRRGDLDFSLSLPENESTRAAGAALLDTEFAGMTCKTAQALPIAILLFLSMLPLHSDAPERQMALLANAMRLFAELDKRGDV